MAGFDIAQQGGLLTVNGTANGVVTLASTFGYYVDARLWISSSTQPSVECKIIAISGATLQLRAISTSTTGGYGTFDASLYTVAQSARVDMAAQFVATAIRPGFSDFFVYSGTALVTQVPLTSSVASGFDAIKLLDGARLNFSTSDPTCYLARSASNHITTPAQFTVSSILNTSDIRSIANNACDIGLTGNRYRHFYCNNFTAAALFISATAPTVSGFGTSPSVPSNNGTIAFTIDVGTGGVASTGTVTLPAATTGWVITCNNITDPGTHVTRQTGGTTTTATVTNYSQTTGLAIAWTASAILRCTAVAY